MRIAVLGAGAWGTAIACVLAARQQTLLYVRDPEQGATMRQTGTNARYLPGIELPSALQLSSDFGAAVGHGRDLHVIATPMAALTSIITELRHSGSTTPFVWLAKGFDESTQRLAHQIIADEGAPEAQVSSGPLSGPSFAIEVARGLPTALTVAGPPELGALVTEALHGGAVRIYTTQDVIGVEVGGAVKNVLAIATGIADALGLGHNARAALITRGLAETTRLGVALGAQPETFMGLTGVGDLILTATGDLSRNRQVGLALGRGANAADAVAQLGHVAEGVRSAHAVRDRARTAGVEMPITEAVCAVLDGGLTPARALNRLLAREPKTES